MLEFAALLLLAGQAAAAPPPAPEEKKLCRRVEATGSILGGKRVCRTRAEWARLDERNARRAEAMRNMPLRRPAGD